MEEGGIGRGREGEEREEKISDSEKEEGGILARVKS